MHILIMQMRLTEEVRRLDLQGKKLVNLYINPQNTKNTFVKEQTRPMTVNIILTLTHISM